MEDIQEQESLDSSTEVEQPEQETDKALSTAIEQKARWREKALAFEEELKKIKKTPESSPTQSSDKLDPNAFVNRDEWMLGNKGYSVEETQRIIAFAKGMGVTVEDALKDDVLVGGIEVARSKQQSDQATPAPSHKAATVRESREDFSKLSRSEQKAEWRKSLQAARDKRNRFN